MPDRSLCSFPECPSKAAIHRTRCKLHTIYGFLGILMTKQMGKLSISEEVIVEATGCPHELLVALLTNRATLDDLYGPKILNLLEIPLTCMTEAGIIAELERQADITLGKMAKEGRLPKRNTPDGTNQANP